MFASLIYNFNSDDTVLNSAGYQQNLFARTNVIDEEGGRSLKSSHGYSSTCISRAFFFFFFLYTRFYLDVKGRDLDTEKLFAYRAVSRSFLSM